MSPLPPHSIGNLRPSTVALRHIFGYSDHSLSTPLALEDTNFGAKLLDSPVTDLLLVSVDIDTGSFLSYRILDNEKQYSIGISVLDTRKIQVHSKSTAQDERHQHTIQSFQFTVGQGTYVNRACRRFLFGETKPIIFSELKAEFDAIVQGREYVLICHGSQADIMVLRQLNIGQQALYVLDTVYASRFPLQLHFQPSLERLLELLGIPFHDLHAAGNDAHFVLKALLLLSVHDARVQHVVPSKAELEVLMGLEDIARSPVPAPKPKPPQKPPRIKQPKQPKQPKRTDTARTRRRERRRLEREAKELEDTACANDKSTVDVLTDIFSHL